MAVSAPARTFTIDDAMRRWHCSSETAREILREFVRQGFVAPVGGMYVVTHEGVAASHRVGELKP